jgi:very-short-patch-repair endonuclease
MAPSIHQRAGTAVWKLAAGQHGVVTRAQLLELGFGRNAIKHRVAKGRLHLLERGVYAVGRPELTRHGRWMAAVLGCGTGAALSHQSAGGLYEIHDARGPAIHISIPSHLTRKRPGIVAHRRRGLAAYVTHHSAIPVTSPALTLVDLAACLPPNQLEAAVNEADKQDLIDPEALRAALDDLPRVPGLGALRRLLDRRTFTLTDSELERRFLRIARRAGLPMPQTRRRLNGFRVDFYWPDLGLVVETDGLRYHRTPAEQARDRLRDQAHAAAGLTPLRFTHSQIRWEEGYVAATLAAVAGRLRGAAAPAR